MGQSTLPTRLTIGLTGVAAAAALLTPAAAGAAPSGAIAAAAKPAPVVTSPARSVVPPASEKQMMLVVALAPVGMAGPAAPAPIVLTAKPARQHRIDRPATQAPREIPDVTLPPEAHRFIAEAKLVIARAFGIPTPK